MDMRIAEIHPVSEFCRPLVSDGKALLVYWRIDNRKEKILVIRNRRFVCRCIEKENSSQLTKILDYLKAVCYYKGSKQ